VTRDSYCIGRLEDLSPDHTKNFIPVFFEQYLLDEDLTATTQNSITSSNKLESTSVLQLETLEEQKESNSSMKLLQLDDVEVTLNENYSQSSDDPRKLREATVDSLFPKRTSGITFFVFVHGLAGQMTSSLSLNSITGNSGDLRILKNNLAIHYTHAEFLLCNTMEGQTLRPLEELGTLVASTTIHNELTSCWADSHPEQVDEYITENRLHISKIMLVIPKHNIRTN
jgi:hypothetical protein